MDHVVFSWTVPKLIADGEGEAPSRVEGKCFYFFQSVFYLSHEVVLCRVSLDEASFRISSTCHCAHLGTSFSCLNFRYFDVELLLFAFALRFSQDDKKNSTKLCLWFL